MPVLSFIESLIYNFVGDFWEEFACIVDWAFIEELLIFLSLFFDDIFNSKIIRFLILSLRMLNILKIIVVYQCIISFY